MRYVRALACALLVPLAVACTGADDPKLEGAAGGAGGAGTSSAAGGSSSSGDIPSTCAQADESSGCCNAAGILYYCTNEGTVYGETCPAGTVCGWDASKSYYACVASPGGADPSNTHPLLCETTSGSSTSGSGASSSSGSGGSSSSSSGASSSSSSGASSSSSSGASSSSSSGASSSSSSASSSSSGGGAVTWTTLFDTIFGGSGTSPCIGCHDNGQGGFTSGITKTSCYTGMVNKGLITPGAKASTSELVKPGKSPLCGSLNGTMPLVGACVTQAQITEIKAWLATGAPDN